MKHLLLFGKGFVAKNINCFEFRECGKGFEFAKFQIQDQRMSNYLTPWSRVLPEKLTGSQLVKKFPAFYGTRKFITAFTTARHLFLS
jgi:hypothetical protein